MNELLDAFRELQMKSPFTDYISFKVQTKEDIKNLNVLLSTLNQIKSLKTDFIIQDNQKLPAVLIIFPTKDHKLLVSIKNKEYPPRSTAFNIDDEFQWGGCYTYFKNGLNIKDFFTKETSPESFI